MNNQKINSYEKNDIDINSFLEHHYISSGSVTIKEAVSTVATAKAAYIGLKWAAMKGLISLATYRMSTLN